MPSGNRVEIEGVKSLARNLRKAGEEGARDFLLAANKEAAQIVESAARPKIPQRTGRLAASLKSSGSARGGVVQVGKARVPWAGPIHFGWHKRNIKPQPFLYIALDDRRVQVEETFMKRLEELITVIEDSRE